MVILFWRFRALFIPPLDQEFGEITAAIYMDVYSNIIVAPFHATFSIKRTNGSDLAIKSLIWKDQKIREVSGSFAADPELHLALNEEIRPWQHARSFVLSRPDLICVTPDWSVFVITDIKRIRSLSRRITYLWRLSCQFYQASEL